MLRADYYQEPTELDRLVFEKLVPGDHYLRRVRALVDFEFVRSEVADCYSAGMGRPAEDPVVMFKLVYLQMHYGLSDREVVRQAQVNVAYRYFLDLSLESQLPVYSLLSQFRSRLGVERFQRLFDQIVGQAREQGLVKDRLRLKDATHVIANMAVPSTLQLVAQVRNRLLVAAQPYAEARVAAEWQEVDRVRLATSDLPDGQRLLQRVEHLRRIVAWADQLSAQLGPPESDRDTVRLRFEAALALAHRLLADQDDPRDRLRSAVDPDARRGWHGQYFDGYLLDISMDADSELITALEVLPGNGDEAQDAPHLISSEEEAHGNDISALSMDGIGWNGRMLRTLSDAQGPGLAVYVPPQVRPSDGDLFTPHDFTLAASGSQLTCPGGQQTTSRRRNAKDSAWVFSFARHQCQGCALLPRCVKALPQHKGRTVTKNDYQAEYDGAWARSYTPEYTQIRQQHPRVEGKLADLVRYHGGRRARYRGRWQVKIQYLLTAIAVNIKRMVRLSLAQAPASPT